MYQMFAFNFYSFFVVKFLSDKTSKRFSFAYIKQKQFYIFVYNRVLFPSNNIKFMKTELTFRDHNSCNPLGPLGQDITCQYFNLINSGCILAR